MKKNDVRKIIMDAVKPHVAECNYAGDRKNSVLLYIKDIDEAMFLVTIEDEAPDVQSLQDIKTKMHFSVCRDIVLRYVRNICDDDEFGYTCETSNSIGEGILGYIVPAMNALEGLVLPGVYGECKEAPGRTIYEITESLAYYSVAGLVELGQASSKDTVFEGICGELNALYDKKNRDYGDAFAKSLDKYGLMVLCIRLSDKLNRFKALAIDGNERMVDDECVFDTLKDFANYAILGLIEMRLKQDKEPQK